jgi:hypothetical protein
MIEVRNRMATADTRTPERARVFEIVNEFLAQRYADLILRKHDETLQVELVNKERLAVK